MREAVMSGMVLADDSLINLFPDPAWDVAGFRDLAGGVIAVCLYAAVAMVIVGVLTLLPGLITNNMMERAFSWKRLLCALMIPLTIGAATSGFAWGAGAFGTDGLAVNDSYQSANGHPDWKGVKNDEAKKSDDLGGVVRQLGEDIANRVGKAAGDAIDKALSTGKEGVAVAVRRRREGQRVREDGPGGGRPVVVPVRLSRPPPLSARDVRRLWWRWGKEGES